MEIEDANPLTALSCLWVVCLALLLLPLFPRNASSQPIDVTKTLPLGLPLPAPTNTNPALASLGEYLFNSKALSQDGSTACASCHIPRFGFADEGRLSVGVKGYVTSRRALPLFNLYSFTSFTADGRAKTLLEQHRIPLQSPEMNIDWDHSVNALSEDPAISALTAAAEIRKLGPDNIMAALASYSGELVSGGSRFDRYYYNSESEALTEQEKRGLRIFVRKARCATCHLMNGLSAPFTDGGFHSIGIGFSHNGYKDHGRMEVSRAVLDDGKFKTPTLRNVAQRSFFMHDGSIGSLLDVVNYYNRGGTANAPNQDARLQRLFLSGTEMADLVAFLGSLTGPVLRYEPASAQSK